MTDKQFAFCWREAISGVYTDRDAYISDIALSSVWGDAPEAEIPQKRLDNIGRIWNAAHRTAREIRDAAGLTQQGIADRFCIPLRTWQHWEAGDRECPPYVRLMMQKICGLI